MAKRKTTLMVEENLYSEIQRRAISRRASVSDTVNEALREYLAKSKERRKVALPAFDVGALRLPPEIDVNKTSDVLAYLDSIDREESLF